MGAVHMLYYNLRCYLISGVSDFVLIETSREQRFLREMMGYDEGSSCTH